MKYDISIASTYITKYVQWVDIKGIQTKLVGIGLKHENMFAQRNRDTTVHIYSFFQYKYKYKYKYNTKTSESI